MSLQHWCKNQQRKITKNYSCLDKSSTLLHYHVPSRHERPHRCNHCGWVRLSAARKTGEFPPATLVKIYQEPGAESARLRRHHLIIVDLCYPRKAVWCLHGRQRSTTIPPLPWLRFIRSLMQSLPNWMPTFAKSTAEHTRRKLFHYKF